MQDLFSSYIISPIFYSIRKFGNRNAFYVNGIFYTYHDLGESISKIRNTLKRSNTCPKLYGLVINDDLETYASIIALWSEGKGFVPLHPFHPFDRCLNIIEQVSLTCILDSSETTRYSDQKVINTKKLRSTSFCFNVYNNFSDLDLAYVLFTSGSTGTPKGVMISRQNIGAFMDSFWKTGIVITEEDRCLQCFDLTFDVSIQSFLVALTKGACVYTIPHGEIKYIYVISLIQEHKLTLGAMPPSLLMFLKPYLGEIDVSSLKTCIITAEACPLSLMEEWFKCVPNSNIYDFYGPTETTIYCTYYKLEKTKENKILNGIISIGKPLSNVFTIIVDENNEQLPIGEKGELCVAGLQVTPGYWNNPQRNEEAFFEKEVQGELHRFYHTGDLCYQDVDGDIMYSGRMDNQVKIQGFRVEMSEIEHHAREFLKEMKVLSVAYETNEKHIEIALFIESDRFGTEELMKYLRSKMPSYMIPKKIFFETSFPLNANDKIDRNKLKLMIWKNN